MIPRLLHRVWLGSNPIPEEFQHYGETWRKHHAEWEMRLWTDDNLPELRFPELLERARHHAERADVLRQEVLLRFGGVYVDTDVECRRPIEPLIEGVSAFAAWSHRGRIGNAVLGAEPGHPAFERILEELRERVGRGNVVAATGPKLVTRVLADAPNVTLFGPETFYPYSPREPRPADDDPRLAAAYAMHHWGATWKTREDYRAWVRRLKRRLDEADARNRRLKRQRRRLRRERDRLLRDLERTRQQPAARDGAVLRRARAGGSAALRRLSRPAGRSR